MILCSDVMVKLWATLHNNNMFQGRKKVSARVENPLGAKQTISRRQQDDGL